MLTQALEEVIAAYRVRHEQCTNSTGLPGKYIVMSMRDEFAGLGNQFPSIITGSARLLEYFCYTSPGMGGTTQQGAACLCPAGFLLALLTERCFFIEFPFYEKSFAPGVDFSWARQSRRLQAAGHDVAEKPPLPMRAWTGEDVSAWLLQDQKEHYEKHYGIMLLEDPDYSAALLQANPYHRNLLKHLFPTGEMFHPLARFLLKVSKRPAGRAVAQRSMLACTRRLQKRRTPHGCVRCMCVLRELAHTAVLRPPVHTACMARR